MSTKEFKNEGQYEFITVDEDWREYRWADGACIRIVKPIKLAVSLKGHRLWDAKGISHFIPYGWIWLKWEAEKAFVK